MDVITIESKAFKELMEEIRVLSKYVKNVAHGDAPFEVNEEDWVDNYEVCTFLKISDRTLLRLRKAGIIPYATLSDGKAYYKIKDIRKALEERYIPSNEDCLKDLILNHKRYVEQRRDNKPNQ